MFSKKPIPFRILIVNLIRLSAYTLEVNLSEISSVTKILNLINKSESKLCKLEPEAPFRFWYRGESGDFKKNKLVPGIYRFVKNRADFEAAIERESYLIDDFYLYSPNLFDHVPKDGWEWLSLIQHHRLPSRLLDWSENRLQSIFFAFHMWDLENQYTPMFYIMNPNNLNKLSINDESIYFADTDKLVDWLPDTLKFFETKNNQMPKESPPVIDKTKPIAIYTRHTFERISKQSGCFVLFGEYYKSLEDYVKNSSNILDQIKLYNGPDNLKAKKEYRESILNQLDILGVNEFTTYGGLDYLAEYLKRIYK